ncbi:MAG TPA: two-component regulator propeller domain-containing protein [Sphingobacteriaceae bacterium]
MRLYELFYKSLFSLFLCFLVSPAGAQTLNFKELTVDKGLVSSIVYYSYQDSKGFMWFATEAGVSRYDGSRFESFSIEDGLSDNEILWIQEDSQHRIWFLTLNGQLCYYYKNKFYNPSNNSLLKKASPKASLIYFFEDSKKQIWLCTTQQEIVLIGHDFVQFYKLPSKYFIANSFVTEDKNGTIWILNQKNAFKVVGKKLIQTKMDHYPISSKSFMKNPATRQTFFLAEQGLVKFVNGKARLVRKIPSNIIKQGLGHFLLDDDNSLWLTTQGNGITHLGRNNEINQYLHGLYVSHVLKDREGNIWFSTYRNGVYQLSEYTKSIVQYAGNSGLNDDAVHSITRDQAGHYWLGLRNGGVNILDHLGYTTFKNLRITNNPYNPMKIVTADSNNRSVWFATNNSLGEIKQNLTSARYLREKSGEIFAIKSFSLSGDGQLAFALASGVYLLPDKNAPLIFSPSVSIPGKQQFFPLRAFTTFFDSRNNLWFSNIKGLFKYENNALIDYSALSPLLTKRITDIKELPDGSMALSTYGYGIIILKEKKILHHLTTRIGLTSNIVTRLRVHGDFLWAVSNRGVNKILINGQSFHIDTFQTEDGLISDEVNDIFVKGQNIYAVTNKGLTILKDNKRRADTLPPPLYLTSLRIGERLVTDTSSISLKHNENNISVNFTAINYNDAKKITYRYQLKPGDPYVLTNNTSIDFASLEPEEYHLRIEARSDNSRWSDPILFKMVVYPPFWKSLAFIILVSLLAAALIMQGLRSYFKAQRMQEEEELLVQNKIIALEQQALQAMMNPHFVFNVMNSIQHFINTRNELAANKVLTGFARLIRTNMEVCTKSFITLEEEIEYLKLYLSLESLRFGERMSYQIETDEGIDTEEVFLPSMLLQPFVENAIWHGIMPKEEGGRIEIHISRSGADGIMIDILDDGIGVLNGQKNKDKGHVSRGMQLTNDRIKLLNKPLKKPIVLSVEQRGESGTRVNFVIPLV